MEAAKPCLRKMLSQCPFVEGEDREIDGALETLLEILPNHFGEDGYHLAKALEDRHCWFDMTLEDANELDNAQSLLSAAHTKVVSDWVQEQGITVPYEIGQWIEFTGRHNKTTRGEVVNVNAQVASLVVRCPSLGHVRKGNGTHGLYVNVEEVQRLVEPTATEATG